MNIDQLTKELNDIKNKIDNYQCQIDILNNNNRYYSCFKFVMSAHMVSYGNSEMPSDEFDLPHELKIEIGKMYKEYLEKEIEKLKTERKNLIKKVEENEQ